jgi:guanosine-3',5'-bis(diphosphate) 3'-pyrophosphohydrolase
MEEQKVQTNFDQVIGHVREYMPDADFEKLQKACDFAMKIHGNTPHQYSGLPFIIHAVEVANILASMRLDMDTIVAGLLHGVLKADRKLSIKEMGRQFGKDVANIVRGATRITNVRFTSKLTYQAENVRKLLLAMASDIRVLLVKLADRLHDMRSMRDDLAPEGLPRETIELYAPLASRLGIDWMKRELEDLAFKHLYPDEYSDLVHKIESSTADRQQYVEEVMDILSAKLQENNIPLTDFRITGRPKHLYSIYKKIIAQKIPVEKVYDKVAFRIIVKDIKQCYEVLGIVHANWAPVPGRIKDFISMPKSNNYQSMHTTVLGPHGEFMEVQIRTEEMDKVAQEGVAAHWAYKEGQDISREDARVFKSLKQLVQWLQELKDPKEFLESVRGELFEPDVYALTPQGDVKGFRRGSTPIDFAYSIHTEVGDHCAGAKVNGRMVPLKYEMQNGDVVEIITSPTQKPRRGWLAIAKTSRAKSRIRYYLRGQEKEKAISLGREICERELKKYNTTLKKIIKTGHVKQVLKSLKSLSLDDLMAKVGSGVITVRTILKELQPEELRSEMAEQEEKAAARPAVRTERTAADEAVIIEGVNDMLVKISQCCHPVPGDDIMGFITTGRGVSIHKTSCRNLLATDPHRRIEVKWAAAKMFHRTQIRVVAQNRKGMLATISNAINSDDVNIVEMEARTSANNFSVNTIVVEVENLKHLQTLLQHLRQLDGVTQAVRH